MEMKDANKCATCARSFNECFNLHQNGRTCSTGNGFAEWKPKQPAREQQYHDQADLREQQEELVTVPIVLPDDLRKKVDCFAAQCGLTSEQMASAMIVLALKDIKHVEPEPPKPATISINGVEVKAPHFVGHSFEFVREKFTVNIEYKNQADAEAFKAALKGRKP